MTDRERLYEEAHERMRIYGLKRGQVWRHYKGDLYVVLGMALKEDDLTVMVHYQNLATGVSFTRPFDEWQQCVKIDDGTCPRRFSFTHNVLPM